MTKVPVESPLQAKSIQTNTNMTEVLCGELLARTVITNKRGYNRGNLWRVACTPRNYKQTQIGPRYSKMCDNRRPRREECIFWANLHSRRYFTPHPRATRLGPPVNVKHALGNANSNGMLPSLATTKNMWRIVF